MSVSSSSSGNAPTNQAASQAIAFAALDRGLPEALPPLRTNRSHEVTLDWLAAAERLGLRVDLDASAHSMGAMVRRRGVPSATSLLCLALLYGPARMPLRLIAERCAALGIARVSEPALLRRLTNAARWLEHVADTLIVDHFEALELAPGPPATQMRLAATVSPASWPLASAHDRRDRQLQAAKRFIFDFTAWPEELFSDSQVHWLLCLRWMVVTSTIKDPPSARADGGTTAASELEHGRRMAHLLGALASADL